MIPYPNATGRSQRERICQRPRQTPLVLFECDHVSFFISILLSLPQASSPRAVSLEGQCPHPVDFMGTTAEGLGLQERTITHNFPLDVIEAGGCLGAGGEGGLEAMPMGRHHLSSICCWLQCFQLLNFGEEAARFLRPKV